jgi:hypothetical protein
VLLEDSRLKGWMQLAVLRRILNVNTAEVLSLYCLSYYHASRATFSTLNKTEMFHQRHSYFSREVNRTSVTYKGKMHRKWIQFKCEAIDREVEMLLWKINYILMINNVPISTVLGLIYSA